MAEESFPFDEFVLDDIMNHHLIEINLKLEGCKWCLAAKLFALSFIHYKQKRGFSSEEFKRRADHIVDGLFLFLQEKPISSIYAILPQLEGIVKDHLISKGILEEAPKGYPIWTNKAIQNNARDKCSNIKQAIYEGVANPLSLIGKAKFIHPVKYDEKFLEPILQLRNKTIHGSLITIEGHEAVNVIILLYALYHDIELK